MEKMRICICECFADRQMIKKEIISSYFKEKKAKYIIFEFDSAQELLLSENLADIDIFVIDADAGDTDGVDLIRDLKEICRHKTYILTSDNYDRLDEAMDLGVIRYILNGAEKESYYSALDKAVEDINSSTFLIKGCNGDLYCLHKNEIVYVEAKGRKTLVLTANGVIRANLNISQIRKIINTPNFISPHYSFLVNSDYFSRIEGKDLLLKVNYHYFRIPIASKRVCSTKKQLINM